ncbi:putative urea ABC transporter substrate-binding protein [Nisaea acidiphila]|uniref:Urea ABC transporter substrate-binding protein n=1 Tax=Nisaea acidiphila TaxID=1862145 RepID=A0A9J7AY40_9PROT|nr:putative urea ABC transporter substrate-binding protein [Nisaea acidiphila]UUX51714.1 putative urea ABC transporter substrate-binding protein [Nisaea acidiphila]
MFRQTLLKIASAAFAVSVLLAAPGADAAPKKEFKVCWSIYVGWMPWGEIQNSGLMKKWADKYGISVDIVQINDYIESINQYTAGEFDGCSMTNMDALSIPSGGGVDTTALIVGDYSNGNDGIVLKGKKELAGIKGQTVNLVELSVSHYLLVRALDSIGLAEKDITVVNTSDADMIAAYGTPDVSAVVTWNPLLSEIEGMPESYKVFDSSQTPGEIIDIMMVNTETLADNPDFGKALAGAWYEMMSIMSKDDSAGMDMRTAMAKASGTDLAGYDSQLASTAMFYEPAEAVSFTKDPALITTMDFVRKFLFDKGILGEGATSVDFVGIAFPGGKTLGDTGNIKLRFDPAYMEMAAAGKL